MDLYEATQMADLEQVQKQLLNHDYNLNVKNESLFHASRNEYLNIAQLLLDWGAQPDSKDANPLFWACANKDQSMVDLFLNWGVNPNINPLILVCAIRNGYLKIVWKLLDAGADPNLEPGACIQLSIKYNQWSVVKFLLKRGALISMLPHCYSDLDKLFQLVLERRDPEQIYRPKWPDWLMHKYEHEIQIIID